jgi:hypothetical protein
MLFDAGNDLRRIDGFRFRASLIRIDIPVSVGSIGFWVFSGCASFLELRMRSGTRIRAIGKSGGFQAFIVYEDDKDMKLRRRQLHLSTVGLRVFKTGPCASRKLNQFHQLASFFLFADAMCSILSRNLHVSNDDTFTNQI